MTKRFFSLFYEGFVWGLGAGLGIAAIAAILGAWVRP